MLRLHVSPPGDVNLAYRCQYCGRLLNFKAYKPIFNCTVCFEAIPYFNRLLVHRDARVKYYGKKTIDDKIIVNSLE